MNTNHCRRDRIHPGDLVDIVLKKDQPTGKLTRGIVGRLLTNKGYHPRGIKVMLTDGQVGRVQHICGLASLEQETRHYVSSWAEPGTGQGKHGSSGTR